MQLTGRQGHHWLLRGQQAFSSAAVSHHPLPPLKLSFHIQPQADCSKYQYSGLRNHCNGVSSYNHWLGDPQVWKVPSSTVFCCTATLLLGAQIHTLPAALGLRRDRQRRQNPKSSGRGAYHSLGGVRHRLLNLRCFMQHTVESESGQVIESGLLSLDCPERDEYIVSIGGYNTELLELKASKPSFHVIVIPGNPGISAYYRTYVSSLFERLGGKATVTAISYVGFTEKSWEGWRTFSLQDQIDHKAAYMEQVCRTSNIPIVLVGHSIGAYICLSLLRQFSDRVSQVVGLYPFLTLNPDSRNQRVLSSLTHVIPVCVLLSLILAALGALPFRLGPLIAGIVLKRKCEPLVTEITTRYLLKYHVTRNITHLGKTEFDTLWRLPDWDFFRANQRKIALIFGTNDHWGPFSLLKEVNSQAPLLKTIVEREGHLHAFCCTTEGSKWVARETAKFVEESIMASM